jgi:hypothetical protein
MPSKNCKIIEITGNQDKIEYCQKKNAVVWGSELYSTEQYILREKHLKNQTISSNPVIDSSLEKYREFLGTKFFAFVDLDLPETDEFSQIVSSCETLNRVAYIQVPGSSETIPSLSACIGGVFTPSEFRGKGYASSMITHLNKLYDDIAQSNGPDDSFLKYTTIFLYSEVGDFYEGVEYQSRHIPLHEFSNDDALTNYIKESHLVGSEKAVVALDLDHSDQNLSDCLNKEIEECEKLSVDASVSDKHRFFVKPDLDIYKWFKARDTFISDIAFPELIKKNPLIDGFKIKDSNSHVIWHHNWNENKLYVLKLYIEETDNNDDLNTLLVKCLEELKKYDMKKLVIWDDDLKIAKKDQYLNSFASHSGIHLHANNESLSAIRASWIEDINDLEWINNSKYLWF